MLGLFYCFLSSGIFIKEIRYLYIVSIKNNILLRFQIILFPKTNLRRKQMAKSDLLKEAIADAKAVKETALANAKIALQEAFQPRIKSMLETELIGELEDDEMAMDEPMDDMAAEPAMDDMGDEMGAEGEPMDVGDIEIDTDMDGEIDFTGDIMSKPGMDAEPEMDDMGDEPIDEPMGDLEGDAAMGDDAGDELGIEEIIRELEEDLEAEGTHEGMYMAGEEDVVADEEDLNAGMKYEMYSADKRGQEYNDRADNFRVNEDSSIDDLIEAILAEEEDEKKEDEVDAAGKDEDKEDTKKEAHCNEAKEALEEAYHTVGHLKSVINEVNLLNAKLLYTNKLFRNFDLNEGQKMKVIENFDRAGNTREAKLVFATLAESFHKPTAGKKIVKESKSMASKPVATTAPSKETTQVLTEGFEQANRWKKLAGLIK
jgi:hypothetical protein